MRGVGGFHFIQEREAPAGDVIAHLDIISRLFEIHDLQKRLAALDVGELGNFFDNLSKTHKRNLSTCWVVGKFFGRGKGGTKFEVNLIPFRLMTLPYMIT